MSWCFGVVIVIHVVVLSGHRCHVDATIFDGTVTYEATATRPMLAAVVDVDVDVAVVAVAVVVVVVVVVVVAVLVVVVVVVVVVVIVHLLAC